MTRQQITARLGELADHIRAAHNVGQDFFATEAEREYFREKLPGWLAEREEHEKTLGAMNMLAAAGVGDG